VYGLKLMLGPVNSTDLNNLPILEGLEEASRNIESPLIPLILPTSGEELPWASFFSGRSKAWLATVAAKFDCKTTTELSKVIVELEILPIIKPQVVRAASIGFLLEDPIIRQQLETSIGTTDREQIAKFLLDNWDQIPAATQAAIESSDNPLVDSLVAQNVAVAEKNLAANILEINNGETEIKQDNSKFYELLTKLSPAYLSQDSTAFNTAVEDYLAEIKATQPTGYSSRKFSVEKIYNSYSPFYLATAIYLLAFITACFGWIGLHQLWNRVSSSLIILGLGWQITGLIFRVIISGRPPVTNLYSSALFVSMGLVILMLIVERITKLGIGNVVASLGALLALIWAWTMTIVDGDTFTVMVAVLDTQFWLSTHVICISLGYSATFAAGMLGFAYLIGLLVTPAFATVQRRRSFVNLIYGIVCFGLFCSFFGTVLGGLWGDDSWGRFWGWDPKENGALMIVLWNAVVLHARWGGLVKDRGIAALAILGNVVVLWSWKGVNSMGVGLHAYAGTEDDTMQKIIMVAGAHVVVAAFVFIPVKFWMSYAREAADKKILS
ncbi:cytochrome c biogenesis protein CcsA, partial [Mariniblastus sp.]|nr:cytochrome c biogenesis protein CcsA [Mariniblastus sp.]